MGSLSLLFKSNTEGSPRHCVAQNAHHLFVTRVRTTIANDITIFVFWGGNSVLYAARNWLTLNCYIYIYIYIHIIYIYPNR